MFWRSIVVAVVVSFFLCAPALAKPNSEETLRMLDLFGDIFEKVREDYVEEVSDVDLIEASINGMLTSLDPHSSYLSKKAFDEMRIQTKGEFGGLGIEVTMENGLVKVVSPIDDTPAFKAGILAGDLISVIDEEPVMGMTLTEAVDRMRGKIGTEIELSILRDGEPEPLEITIVRDLIKIRSVRSRAEGSVGYVRITSFSEQTSKHLEKALRELKEELDNNMHGVVLDLRNNPGGLLDQAIDVADAFLEQGEIVSTRGRMQGSTKRFSAEKGDIIKGMPLVVLINSGSASASEIVAGALQDHNRAVIMGVRSFGKGSVQRVIPVPGDGAIRITTSRYYTPSGRSIQAEGIEPDIEVIPATVEPVKQKRKSYREASLRGHLDKGGQDSKPKHDSKDSSDKDDAKSGQDTSDASDNLYEKDYQLARAVDLIQGLHLFKQN